MRKSANSKMADTLPALPPPKKRKRAGLGLVTAKVGSGSRCQCKRRVDG